MPPSHPEALSVVLNGGSSSLKFAVRELNGPFRWVLRGRFENVGRSNSVLVVPGLFADGDAKEIPDLDHAAAAGVLLDWLDDQVGLGRIAAVGHRIVHGGPLYSAPQVVDDVVLAELARLQAYAPEHLPSELEIIACCRERLGEVPQIACFDTAFHRDLPRMSRLLPIPRRFEKLGAVRYGFHGLSYEHVIDTLRNASPGLIERGRIVVAHLGNGASLCAIRNGGSIDTTMAFTPAAGIPMGTRSGDIDPGLVLHLANTGAMDAKTFDRMANHESGLLGISETSSDVRDLLAIETTDRRAAEALDLFCYNVRKQIGAYAAALGGLDAVVFTGGIGENSSVLRERICGDLGFLGIELDPARNVVSAPVISREGAHVEVRVIAADEEDVVSRAVRRILNSKESFL
jgi:acetate kinase